MTINLVEKLFSSTLSLILYVSDETISVNKNFYTFKYYPTLLLNNLVEK